MFSTQETEKGNALKLPHNRFKVDIKKKITGKTTKYKKGL